MAPAGVIAFDGDDTLWHNEAVFSMTQDRFAELVAPYAEPQELGERLYAIEMKNLRLFGYGVKAFVLSMIETAVELSDGAITGREVQRIIDAGKDMLSHPVQLLDGVEHTIASLATQYRLMLITKGDLFDQESKLARSGLADHFWRIAVVAEKDAATYRRVLEYHDLDVGSFVMVGNSVPSDVLPVVEIGGTAIHVPFHLVWAHEHAEPVRDHARVWNIDTIRDVPAVVARIVAERP